MDTYQQFLEIEEELKCFLKGLNIDSRSIADFIVKNPGKSPLSLVYKTSAGQIESDDRIREDLSTLIGYEISYKNGENNDVTAVILFKTITKEMLEARNCLKDATVGDLLEIAKTIHPEAKIINKAFVMPIWLLCKQYYTLKFLLHKMEFEIPDIQVLLYDEESKGNDSHYLGWESSLGCWGITFEGGGSGVIGGELPVLCYYLKKQ